MDGCDQHPTSTRDMEIKKLGFTTAVFAVALSAAACSDDSESGEQLPPVTGTAGTLGIAGAAPTAGTAGTQRPGDMQPAGQGG